MVISAVMAQHRADVSALMRRLNITNMTDEVIKLLADYDFRYTSNNSISPYPLNHYCSGVAGQIADTYRLKYHGWASVAVCAFGTIANVLNVAVLTRSRAPINLVLTWLAVADMLVMIEYIPFACYHNIVFPEKRDFEYAAAVFVLFHMNFSQVMHTISVSLTLALAGWRCVTVSKLQPPAPRVEREPASSHRVACIAIILCYAIAPILCAPYYFVFHVAAVTIVEEDANLTLYRVDLSSAARANNDRLYEFSFCLYAVLFKLAPCCFLTGASVYLMQALTAAGKRRSAAAKRAHRTTRMLIAVLLLFLTTELPQAIMGLLSVALGKDFFVGCYNKFGDMLDMLALLNGAINFILYCTMSKQFRITFGYLFKPKIFDKYWPKTSKKMSRPGGGGTNATTSVQNTYV